MRQIEVCVGSSCFLKGAYHVLDTFTSLARQYAVESDVRVVGSFCMEQCQHGVSVAIDGTVYSVPDATEARLLFGRLFLDESENRT